MLKIRTFLRERFVLAIAFVLALGAAPIVAQSVFLPSNVGLIGHIIAGAPSAPVGTGCTIVAGSSDTAGECLTTATSGTIVFAQAFTSAPTCIVVDRTATPVAVYATTTTQITLTTVTSAHNLSWNCWAKIGG